MLTKWAKAVTALNDISGSNYSVIPNLTTSGSSRVTAVVAATSASGNTFYVTNHADGQSNSVIVGPVTDSTSNNAGFAIGSSDAVGTDEDYNLKTPITSGFTGSVTATNVYDSDTNTMKVRYIITITNTGETALTINEIARFLGFSTASAIGSAASARKTFMIDRSVLPATVTIPAGESGVIHYDFIEFEPAVEPVP